MCVCVYVCLIVRVKYNRDETMVVKVQINFKSKFYLFQEHLIGLCEFRRSLYVGNKKIVTGCTSFGVHDEFLLLTTDSHTCRVIPLNSDVDGT